MGLRCMSGWWWRGVFHVRYLTPDRPTLSLHHAQRSAARQEQGKGLGSRGVILEFSVVSFGGVCFW